MPKKQPACSKSSKTKTQSITCAARVTPIKATLESVIANPTILKKPKDPRLPAVGTKFVKRFKGKDLEIEVKEDGSVEYKGGIYSFKMGGTTYYTTEKLKIKKIFHEFFNYVPQN